MHSLAQRLRAALAPDYEVERELGAGGMGRVFLARDVALDHPVAIKVIRPELATAAAVERFIGEARILASIDHPNIVGVHRAGEAGGLSYFVMAYLGDEPLSKRLERGPLPRDEVVRLAQHVLSALEAAHARGIIHRDLKPSNIFMKGERYVVIDFGIARTVDASSSVSTLAGGGTPAYMAPEQFTGGTVSYRTDLYAAGAVIYEALSGRRWMATPGTADWTSIPPRLVPVLKCALAWAPADRWGDARSFREAFLNAGRPLPVPPGIAAALMVVVAAISIYLIWQQLRPGPEYRAAIFPLAVTGAADSLLGRHVVQITTLNLGAVTQAKFVPYGEVIRHSGQNSSPPHSVLRTEHIARGFVSMEHGQAVVRVTLERANGGKKDISFRGPPEAVPLGDALTLHILVALGLDALDRAGRLSGRSWDAVRPFLLGDDAFARDDWRTAEGHYLTALERDPTFGLAWWQLAIVRKWLPGRRELDLRRLTKDDTLSLLPADHALIDAESRPRGEPRLRAYEVVRRDYPRHPLAMLLHGDELFHRGPLVGIPLDTAVSVLQSAALDRNLSPALEHAVWAEIRLGRCGDAGHTLARLDTVAGPAAGSDPSSYTALMRLAYNYRCRGRSGNPPPEAILGALSDTLKVFVARAGLSFVLPGTEQLLGDRLFRTRDASARVRGGGAIAQGLALFARGRTNAAIAWFDSAAVLLGPEAELQAVQWRLVPRLVGWSVIAEPEIERARNRLETRWAAARNPRALWLLALDALASADTLRASQWTTALRAATSSADEGSPALHSAALLRSIEAADSAARGYYAAALRISEPLKQYDQQRPFGDPFFRAVLYLRRGSWHERLDSLQAAEREWLWSENVDIIGWLDGPAEAAEVDWAFAAYSAYLRSVAAAHAADVKLACAQLARLRQAWDSADAESAELLRDAQRQVSKCDR